MKRISWGSAILLAGAISCPGQTAGMAASGQYAVTERGPNHRVWQRTEYTTNRLGRVFPKTHSFTELAIQVSNCTLTLVSRTAIGTFGARDAISLVAPSAQLVSQGIPAPPNRLVACNTVQEQCPAAWAPATPGAGVSSWGRPPAVTARFTEFARLAGGGNHISLTDIGSASFRDIVFHSAGLAVATTESYLPPSETSLTDCCLDGVALYICGGLSTPLHLALINNSFIGGSLTLDGEGWDHVLTFTNNAFDQTEFANFPYGAGVTVLHSFNAYRTGSPRLTPASPSDVVVDTFNWQAGPLGAYYLPTDSGLINHGSVTADALGLYHFTTQTNQLCAQRLPGGEHLDIPPVLLTLDSWAKRVAGETERYHYRFQRNPAQYENSEAYFRILVMITVLQQDLHVRYNPARIQGPDFSDSRDLFLHGLLGNERQGTCASMPVLYVAIGRRLGYPLKLVTAKAHLFCRWESADGKERLNIEATNQGLNCFPDEYYKTWPVPMSEDEVKEGPYLKSLAPAEELAVFLSARGHCLEAVGRFAEAQVAHAHAHLLAPGSRAYLAFLASAVKQEMPDWYRVEVNLGQAPGHGAKDQPH